MRLWAAPLAALFVCDAGLAGETRIRKSVSAIATATDNVDLDSSGEKEDLILSTRGRVEFDSQGARVRGFGSLEAGFDAHALETSESEFRGRANVAGEAEIVRHRFFVRGAASWTPQIVRSNARTSGGDSSGDDELTQVRTFEVEPIYRHPFGGWATAEVRHRMSLVDVSDGDDEFGNRSRLAVFSGRRLSRLRLAGITEYERRDSDGDDGDLTRRTVRVEALAPITRRIAVTAAIGYDDVTTDDFGEDPEGFSWSVGTRVRPGPRLEAGLAFGQRYGGTDISADVFWRANSRWTVSGAFFQSLDTGQSTALSGVPQVGGAFAGFGQRDGLGVRREPRPEPQVVTDENGQVVSVAPAVPRNRTAAGFGSLFRVEDRALGLSDNTFRARNLQLAVSGAYERDTILLIINGQERRFEKGTPDEFVLSATARWVRELSRRLDGEVSISYRLFNDEEEFNSDPDTETVTGVIGVTYRLADAISMTARYTRTDRFSNDPNEEYTENTVSVGVNATF